MRLRERQPELGERGATFVRCTIPIRKNSCCASRATDVAGAVFTAIPGMILEDLHTCQWSTV